MDIVYVPSDRFFDGVTLQGESGDSGFTPGPGAHKLNFLMFDPKAVWQAIKVNVPKFISADEPTNRIDSHIFNLRLFHDANVIQLNNDGLYSSVGEAA